MTTKASGFATTEEYIEHEVKIRMHDEKFIVLTNSLDEKFARIDRKFDRVNTDIKELTQSFASVSSYIRIACYILALIAVPVLSKYFTGV